MEIVNHEQLKATSKIADQIVELISSEVAIPNNVQEQIRLQVMNLIHAQQAACCVPSIRSKVTPPQLAKRWGVSPDKVLTWIRNGELKAVNVATRRSSRPRYMIDVEAIKEFELVRSAATCPVARTTRRKVRSVGNFF